jgi:DNA (cytosine-5)-methyltransferase 1
MTSSDTEFAGLRERVGLSIEEAAKLLGVTERSIRRYEMNGPRGSEAPPLAMDLMRRLAQANVPQDTQATQQFRFIDLFAGIGGLRRPFEEIGGKCVFTAEWDRYSRQTYAANFHDNPFEHELAGDIRPYAAEPWKVPEHDVLLAGFPCQPFSIAGVSKKNALGRPHGFLCDTQGTLFYDLAKIIAFHEPAAFLLENVKNLERHDGGKTFATIMHVLREELGYQVDYRVISSAPWVPQKRERIFIVGFKKKSTFNFDDLQVPEERHPVLGDILEKNVDGKYTLTEKLWNYLQGYKEKHAKAGNGFGYSAFGPNDVSRTLSARYYKDGSESLILQPSTRPRRLTPRECARLMGFDEPQGNSFKIPVSDTQAYRQFGNAVVVPVVRAVAKIMAPHIERAVSLEQLAAVEQAEPARQYG